MYKGILAWVYPDVPKLGYLMFFFQATGLTLIHN